MTRTSVRYNPAAQVQFMVEDVEYRRDGDRAWLARLYRPQATGPLPALLEIHGGAWNSGDRTANPALAEGLAASGVFVASIDFRMGGADPYPSSLADINYATRWLKLHAAGFNAEAASVGGLGISSGGHLIMLSAMRPGDARYAALPIDGADADATLAYFISCWGVLDPYGRYRMAQERGNGDLVANHDRYFLSVDAMHEANPLEILQRGERASLPPALLIQGTADTGVPYGMIEEVASRYNAAGGEAELALFEGMPHGIAGWPAADVAAMVDRMKGFIARRLGLILASA
ncbi:MAG TPA: alpha/beta hydrolase [Dehalococcoidia bacterium]|nr:alpha/beta hydrolase [Dehalococcoidia bacterium]